MVLKFRNIFFPSELLIPWNLILRLKYLKSSNIYGNILHNQLPAISFTHFIYSILTTFSHKIKILLQINFSKIMFHHFRCLQGHNFTVYHWHWVFMYTLDSVRACSKLSTFSHLLPEFDAWSFYGLITAGIGSRLQMAFIRTFICFLFEIVDILPLISSIFPHLYNWPHKTFPLLQTYESPLLSGLDFYPMSFKQNSVLTTVRLWFSISINSRVESDNKWVIKNNCTLVNVYLSTKHIQHSPEFNFTLYKTNLVKEMKAHNYFLFVHYEIQFILRTYTQH